MRETLRYTIIAGFLILALFVAPFDFISTAQSSVDQETNEIASALDDNQNRVLDDAEILNAIQLWILGEAVNDGDIITDQSILSLVQVWITGETISVGIMADDDSGNAETPVTHNKLYWTEHPLSVEPTTMTNIKSCEIDNCATTTSVIASVPLAFQLQSTDTNLYWIGFVLDPLSVGIQTCPIESCASNITDVTTLTFTPGAGLFNTVPGIPTWDYTVRGNRLFVSTMAVGVKSCVITNCAATLKDTGLPASFMVGVTTGK